MIYVLTELKQKSDISVCEDGMFGFGCIAQCSGNCVDDSPCNKHTGYCDKGCNPGYTNSNCSQSKYIYYILLKNTNFYCSFKDLLSLKIIVRRP